MHARRVVVLPHRVQAEAKVLDAADPFGAVDGAALGGGQDLAARQVDHGHAHLRVELGHDAGLAALHALEVGEVLDRTLEPAERLRARRDARHRDQVHLELLLIELVPELDAAAVVEPADEVDGIHAGDAGRRVGEQRRRLVLAEPPVGDAIGPVDHLLVGRVEDLEGRHDRPTRQGVDLELAAGQLVDPVGEEPEGVLRRRRRRNRRLHLEHPRLLLGERRAGERHGGGRRDQNGSRERGDVHERSSSNGDGHSQRRRDREPAPSSAQEPRRRARPLPAGLSGMLGTRAPAVNRRKEVQRPPAESRGGPAARHDVHGRRWRRHQRRMAPRATRPAAPFARKAVETPQRSDTAPTRKAPMGNTPPVNRT